MVSFDLPLNNWLDVQPPYIATSALGLVAVYYQVHTPSRPNGTVAPFD